MAILIEFEITRLNAALPVADADILFADGSAILKVLSGTNNLQLSDGTNTTVFTDALTQSVTSTVKVFTTARTMQLSVDAVDLAAVDFDGFSGQLEILTDSDDFTVRNLSITTSGDPLAAQSQLGYPGLGRVAYPTAYFPDVEPDQFTLPADITEASLEQLVEFNFPVAGTAAGAQVPYVATNCQISTDNTNFFDNLNAVLGQTIYGRAYAALGYQAATTYTVTSGSITDSFTITTAAGVAVPLAESSRVGYPTLGLLAYPTAPSPYFPNLDSGWDFIEVLGAGAGEGYIEVTPALADGDLIAFSNLNQVVIMEDAQVGVLDPLLETFEYKILKGGTVSGPFTYTVNVVEPDTTIPVITVVGGTTAMLQGGAYTPPTVTASDDVDGDITGSIVVTGSIDVNTIGTQTVSYNVSDSSGNAAVEVVHTVEVSAVPDTTIPAITVNSGTTSMIQGGVYTPPTVTASDDTDGDITADVVQTGTIDVNSAGTQTVYFDVQDAAGNDAVQASHTVVITALDSTPTQFNFVDQVDVALNTLITSAAITVLGINTDSAISVAGGEYSVNGGTYTANAGTVSVNDSVTVRAASSGSNSTAVNVVLTIGGVSDTFTVTTLASVPSDSVPAQFTLGADVTGAALNAVTVRSFSIADIDTDTTFNATDDAEVSADGSTNWGSSFTVSAAGTGYMRLTASGSNSVAVTGGVESGGISDSMTVTTAAIQTDDIYSSNLVQIRSRRRAFKVRHNGRYIPVFKELWSTDKQCWLDFAFPSDVGVNSVNYVIPDGWTELDTRSNVTITSAITGVETSNIYSIKLSTTHTSGVHVIKAVANLASDEVDSFSVKLIAGDK